MNKKNYPDHISEPVRIEIAQKLVLHEFKKLFYDLSEKEFLKMEAHIPLWLEEDNKSQFAQYRDFWNLVDGIMMGFKLKGIVKLLTARNISWSKGEIKVLEARFTTNFPGLKINTLTGEELRNMFKKSRALEEGAKKSSDERYDDENKREEDRVICTEDPDGSIFVHDGNGRLERAVIYNTETIPAYIGKRVDNKPENNFWVPTSMLIALVDMYRSGLKNESKVMLEKLLKQSPSARFELKDRALDKKALDRKEILSQFEDYFNNSDWEVEV